MLSLRELFITVAMSEFYKLYKLLKGKDYLDDLLVIEIIFSEEFETLYN